MPNPQKAVARVAFSLVALALAALVVGGCESAKKSVARTPCKTIAQRATQCQKAIGQAIKARAAEAGNKHHLAATEITAKDLTSETYCKKKVAAILRYLDKDCSKSLKVKICEIVKKRHTQRMKALTRCFTLEDCQKVARCYLDDYARFKSSR